MRPVFLCDAIRTPIGRYAGALSPVRADDLAAATLRALIARHPTIDWSEVDDVVFGCANQAGEDNRNIARMAILLSGMNQDVSGTTINRLCGSGLDAISIAARTIASGDADVIVAGGVESMSRAPFVLGKSDASFSRNAQIFDTTLGWRFINPEMKAKYGVDSMPETAENVAQQFDISRHDQDSFAFRSQVRAATAVQSGRFVREIVPVSVPQAKGTALVIDKDEHPRATTLETLSRLKPIVRPTGTVTAGNASGVNDGACALLIAGEEAVERLGLNPLARIRGAASAGVAPRVMGVGPVPAVRKLLGRQQLTINQVNLIELNEAFAAQALAVLREFGIPDDADFVNRNGGAIALGHPLGMSGARLAQTAALELQITGSKYALCTMCVGVGQGIAMLLERVT